MPTVWSAAATRPNLSPAAVVDDADFRDRPGTHSGRGTPGGSRIITMGGGIPAWFDGVQPAQAAETRATTTSYLPDVISAEPGAFSADEVKALRPYARRCGRAALGLGMNAVDWNRRLANCAAVAIRAVSGSAAGPCVRAEGGDETLVDPGQFCRNLTAAPCSANAASDVGKVDCAGSRQPHPACSPRPRWCRTPTARPCCSKPASARLRARRCASATAWKNATCRWTRSRPRVLPRRHRCGGAVAPAFRPCRRPAGVGLGRAAATAVSECALSGQLRSWNRARQPHARDRASFIPELPGAAGTSGRLEIVDGEHAAWGRAVRFRTTDGHTPGLLLAEIGGEGGVVFCADLISPAPAPAGDHGLRPLSGAADRGEAPVPRRGPGTRRAPVLHPRSGLAPWRA